MTSQWTGDEELPPVARARMAEIRASGTWGSALSTEEFAAIRSVGFEPAGQVLGAAVYNVGYRGGWGCPSYTGFGSYSRVSPVYLPGRTVVSGSGSNTAYAPLVRTLYEARRKAIGRMSAECRELGGHGVVGVLLTIGSFPAGGLEFKAIGTAVRAPGYRDLRDTRQQPFTSDLSGQDFAKLIADGVVPVGLVLGISVGARHDDWLTRSQSRWTAGNMEVQGYSELVTEARHDARRQLERDVARLGAEGVVIQSMNMRVGEHECPAQEGARDHLAEVTMIGTAITHFTKSRRSSERPSLAILSLDPERRQAVRGRRLAQ